MKNISFLAVLISALFFASLPSFADTSIGIIDTRKILEQSEAGKSLSSQLKQRQQQIQTEASAYEKNLETQKQAIISNRTGMKPEEFDAKKKAFEQEFMKNRQVILTKSSDLDTLRKNALVTLQQDLVKAAADVAAQKKFQLILDRQFVVVGQQEMDVTTEVMAKLNQTVKSIPLSSAK